MNETISIVALFKVPKLLAISLLTVFGGVILSGCEEKKADVSKVPVNQHPKQPVGITEDHGVSAADNPETQQAILSDPAENQEGAAQLLDQELQKLRTTIATMRFLAGASVKDKEELRAAIAAIAEKTGNEISGVLAALLNANPSADALTTVIARLYLADPGIAVDAYMNGAKGRTRSFALSAYGSALAEQKDIRGLKIMYDRVPPSQDRTHVASQYVNSVADSRGLSSAILFLRDLDLNEEKRYSLIGLYPYVRENRDTLSRDELEKFYQLASEFGHEQAARARTGG
jgi:hypothetical protein